MVSFQTRNPNLGKFWTASDWKKLIFICGHLEYFTDIWDILCPFGMYIMWSFGIFFPVLVCCTEKNLATLPGARASQGGPEGPFSASTRK
jgi:hypothetical protein